MGLLGFIFNNKTSIVITRSFFFFTDEKFFSISPLFSFLRTRRSDIVESFCVEVLFWHLPSAFLKHRQVTKLKFSQCCDGQLYDLLFPVAESNKSYTIMLKITYGLLWYVFTPVFFLLVGNVPQ